MGKTEENSNQEKKKFRCPFDKDLACENCRLHQPYLGGGGKEECCFKTMSGNIGFLANTGR